MFEGRLGRDRKTGQSDGGSDLYESVPKLRRAGGRNRDDCVLGSGGELVKRAITT